MDGARCVARSPFVVFANVDQEKTCARHLSISGDIDFFNPRFGVFH
jgi:hypothetical protein